MVIFPSTHQLFTVTFQGDADGNYVVAYTRGRSMLRLKREDTETVSVFAVDIQGGGFVYYYTAPTGAVEIPLHNVVANYAGTQGFGVTIRLYAMGNTSQMLDDVIMLVKVADGISYNEAFAPRNKDFDGTLYAYSHACVLPPNVMINPSIAGGVTGKGIIVESNYHAIDGDANWWLQASGVWVGVTPLGQRQNQIKVAPGADVLRIVTGKDSDIVKDYPLAKPDYCADLVCIRWTSLTGAVRQHYFPVVAFVNGNGEQVPLVSPGDGYEVSKSNYKAVKCRLTGLTSYGYWYYMDMIQASDLHAVVYPTASNFETEIASAQTAAWVDTDTMETPSGNGFFNFEFTVNMRQYGKV